MPLHQRDFILRLIEEAGAAVARLRARLGLGGLAEMETLVRDAETAQEALFGQLWPSVRLLDAHSAVMLIGDTRRVAAWAELLRIQAAAHRSAGAPEQADRLTSRADALRLEAERRDRAAG
jgi:hypothetical protein